MAEIKARIGDPTIVSGIVRIGVTEYVALTWLPDLVRELNARFDLQRSRRTLAFAAGLPPVPEVQE